MGIVAQTARKEMVRIGRDHAELWSQIGEANSKVFNQKESSLDQEDIACALALRTLDRSHPLNIVGVGDTTRSILRGLKNKAFAAGKEIFASRWSSTSLSGPGNEWSVHFRSAGFPRLEIKDENICLSFPPCNYRVLFRQQFYIMKNRRPRFELYTKPESCDMNLCRRLVASPNGPFPITDHALEILTGRRSQYGNIVINDDGERLFLAVRKVKCYEGKHIAGRFEEVYGPLP